ncbi:hypothetical protein C8N35_102316 [Breoghania corrubedonensis]|uniref:Uncharacterized protein n=1 Tax=Breoghania corrubedonensis TaxID=665038 RepID=A0A2T5VCX8_9HYPH|nr:hypothetical protein C8N35_102316 [Breoghania corrubedonensis]
MLPIFIIFHFTWLFGNRYIKFFRKNYSSGSLNFIDFTLLYVYFIHILGHQLVIFVPWGATKLSEFGAIMCLYFFNLRASIAYASLLASPYQKSINWVAH